MSGAEIERVRRVLCGVGLVLALGTAAEAKTVKTAEAVLVAAPAGTEVKQVIDGRLWRCLGSGCRGRAVSAPRSQPLVAECKGVTAAFGPVSLYRSGRALDAAELAACNASARAVAPAPAVQAAR